MERWTIHRPGAPANLVREEVERPVPQLGEALIRVLACGINFSDLLMLKGTYQSTPPFPFAPGGEVCGIVESVGEGSDPAYMGSRVVAYCGHGGLSEAVIAPLAACAPVPDGLDPVKAAAIPIAYGSSELALARRARLQPGEWLLVGGAGGGIGLTAIEIGMRMGARVIALARGPAKREAALEMGAEYVIDPSDLQLSGYALRDMILEYTRGARMDVIVDPVGGELSRAMMRTTAFEARVLPLGFASGEVPIFKANHLLVKNVDVIGFWWGDYFPKAPDAVRESLSRLLGWAAEGTIRPYVSDTIPFARAPEALDLLAERKATGKVVVSLERSR